MRLLALVLLGGCELIVNPPPGGDHPEVLVNSITPGSQQNVTVAFSNQRYFVAWQDASGEPPDGDKAIRGRFLTKTGVPQASDLLVNTTTMGSQDHPQVAVQGTSLFVVWSDSSTGSPDLKGRVLTTLGGFAGDEVPINTMTAGTQAGQQVIAAASASFVVVWSDDSLTPPDTDQNSIYVRRFNTMGAASAPEVIVNTTTVGNQYEPALARGADDRILVVWTDAQAGEGGDIRGRMLQADGTPIGSDFVINTTTAMIQEQPYVIGLRQGGYLVAWTDGSQSAVDTDGKAVRARLLDADGVGEGADFVLNQRTQGDQAHPRLVQLPDYTIVLSFEDGSMLAPDTSGNGIRARRLASNGTPMDEEREVNTYYLNDQEDSALAVDLDGNVLVLWEDGSASDGSSDNIRARLYPPGPLMP